MSNIWTISAVSGGPNGALLVGCHIVMNSTGTAYQFTKPNPLNVLSTAGPPLPSLPFKFPTFVYKGFEWEIEVIKLPVGAKGSGHWVTLGIGKLPTGEQNGDFTAQAGGTIAPP